MLHGASVKDVRTIYQSEYSVSTKDLDTGNYIPSCVYMHKSYFKYNGEYVPQDYSKAGKANSIYNRMRGQSQSGANIRLLWTIDMADGLTPKRIEQMFHKFAWRYNASDEAFGTELYLLDTKESLNILYEFVKAYSLKENPSIQRISIFNGANRRVLFENKEAHDIDYSKNNFDKWFNIKDD